MIFGIDHF